MLGHHGNLVERRFLAQLHLFEKVRVGGEAGPQTPETFQSLIDKYGLYCTTVVLDSNSFSQVYLIN